MNAGKGLWVAGALLTLLLGCGDPGTGGTTGEGAESADRMEAPDFEHTDLEGRPLRLSSLRGKTVVIDFWATWCPPCIFQPAELNAFWEAHRESGDLVVLGVEVGGASVEEIRTWARDNDAVAEYPILTGADEDLARKFGAMGFPAMVIVAPDGRIDSTHVGLTTTDEVTASVAHLLGAES